MSRPWAPDFFCREAQRLGYVARSAFKLLQMQKQFKLIGAGASVLDLGCAPGAWLQVACRSLGPLEKGGTVVGIDLKKVNIPSHHCDSRVKAICADVMSLRKDRARAFSPQGMGFSVVLSDMCPTISGITTQDTALSCELGKRALSLAIGKASSKNNSEFLDSSEDDASENGVLRRGGNVVIKLLESEDTKDKQLPLTMKTTTIYYTTTISFTKQRKTGQTEGELKERRGEKGHKQVLTISFLPYIA